MGQLKKLLSISATIALLASCGPATLPPLAPLDTTSSHTRNSQLTPKVDNFQVILDASLSMNSGEGNDFLVARDIVRRMNQKIPTDISYQTGLRNLGRTGPDSESITDLLYGMTNYEKTAFHNNLAKINYVGGPSFMSSALNAAAADLKPFTGKSALIIVSDGLHMEDATATAKKIKEMQGGNFCIHTVAIGNENNGTGLDTLKEIADASQCGYATTDSKLADAAGMNSFIDKVFYDERKTAPKPAPKTVPVAIAPPPVPVAVIPPTPGDSDNDGVVDDQDLCPNTMQGISIDSRGCPTKMTLMINFANDSNYIAEQYMGNIAKAATCINNFPGNVVYIDGHTDSLGPAKYNMELSKKRAIAVTQTLIDKFGISASRMTARGFGESQPVAGNKTGEDRKKNRRVEVACGAPQ
jgi:OOP family OmpA-OmpF porin